VRPPRSVWITLVQSVAVFGVYLSGEVSKLILFTHALEYDYKLCIKRYVPAETSLVELVLCDEYYANVSMMAAFGKEITHPSSRLRSGDRPTLQALCR
jgi:hypothetical protein